MAGIYIHVPFCETRCIYCGFFSTTSLSRRDAYVDAVCSELSRRKDYLRGEDVETIYFGGGTPSQLQPSQIEGVLNHIYNIYNVRARCEVTLEGNPDDMSVSYLSSIRKAGINRLSMGVQSFDDKRLRFLKRRHTVGQAVDAVENAVRVGFDNISIDLMYGFPEQTLAEWDSDLAHAVELPVQHISAYSLMYDEGTVLTSMLDRGEIAEIDDEVASEMYRRLVGALSDAGFVHYEISNFCKPGYHSRHNSSYWKGVPYLGVGAGAHSYDGTQRQYNVESLDLYMSGREPVVECLTDMERYNEFVFTGLRTKDGISLDCLREKFGKEMYDYCLVNSKRHLADGLLVIESDGNVEMLKMSEKGLFVSNDIMSDLMWVD